MKHKVYMEITNCCNLSCSFCPGTVRKAGKMSLAQFTEYANKVSSYADYLYYHLMGEPLLHPDLPEMIVQTKKLGMKPMITTNGTLLRRVGEEILAAGVHKVSISLHSFEANDGVDFHAYFEDCLSFARRASDKGSFCALRLWNLEGGRQERNREVLELLHRAFPGEWEKNRSGMRLQEGVYLEWGNYFTWPELTGEDFGEKCFCYGLRDQVGVLCDGTVVPCCMDRNGDLALGNLQTDTLADILASPRAQKIYAGFTERRAVEPLCRTCGFAHSRVSTKDSL